MILAHIDLLGSYKPLLSTVFLFQEVGINYEKADMVITMIVNLSKSFMGPGCKPNLGGKRTK